MGSLQGHPNRQHFAGKPTASSGPWIGSFVPDRVLNHFGSAMQWNDDAQASLKKDVPFFVRPAVRKRVEVMARDAGLDEISQAFYQEARDQMAPK